MNFNATISIGNKTIGLNHPVYFIADIAANHDGDIERAKDLIYQAAESGADAAKFQHFDAETIVSDYGFRNISDHNSHQASWEKSVFEVYKDASLNHDWTQVLLETCRKAGIEFMTSPYSAELVDLLDPFLNTYKIGSGDITFHELLMHIAKKNKPLIIASGAASLKEVKDAVSIITSVNPQIALMQCNTNYTASPENFKYLNLNVLKTYAAEFPALPLGLSDHTHGHSSVLGAVALGARIIEKHFTDSTGRIGPDHKFSMTPASWRDMVDACRELENSLGDGVKRVEENEKETVIVQRRALRAARQLKKGALITKKDIIALRPCPADGFAPYRESELLEKHLLKDINEGEHFTSDSFG